LLKNGRISTTRTLINGVGGRCNSPYTNLLCPDTKKPPGELHEAVI
jgi:hypothetical protein